MVQRARRKAINNMWIPTYEFGLLHEDEWMTVVTNQSVIFKTTLMEAVRSGYDGKDTEENAQWTMSGAFLYSLTVITTIGYGHIAPRTYFGKAMTIIYAIVGIPLMLLFLTNVGDILAKIFRFLYDRTVKFVSRSALCRAGPPPPSRSSTMRRQASARSKQSQVTSGTGNYNTHIGSNHIPFHQQPPQKLYHVQTDTKLAEKSDTQQQQYQQQKQQALEQERVEQSQEESQPSFNLPIIVPGKGFLTSPGASSSIADHRSNFLSPTRNIGSPNAVTSGDESASPFQRTTRFSFRNVISKTFPHPATSTSISVAPPDTGPNAWTADRPRFTIGSAKVHSPPILRLDNGTPGDQNVDLGSNKDYDEIPLADADDVELRSTTSKIKVLSLVHVDGGCAHTSGGSGKGPNTRDTTKDSTVLPNRNATATSLNNIQQENVIGHELVASKGVTSDACSLQSRAQPKEHTEYHESYSLHDSMSGVYTPGVPGRSGPESVRVEAAPIPPALDEPATVPISIILLVMALYLITGASIFCFWEDWEFLDGVYFCYISLTTIGFGDLVPGNSMKGDDEEAQQKLVICSLYLLFGMALIAMCFNLAQEEVVNKATRIAIKLGMIKSGNEQEQQGVPGGSVGGRTYEY